MTLRTESRAPLSLDTAQRGMLLRECSWCKRVAVGDDWVEVELAVERLGLFGDGTPSAITHGMCPPCFTRVVEELEVV